MLCKKNYANIYIDYILALLHFMIRLKYYNLKYS